MLVNGFNYLSSFCATLMVPQKIESVVLALERDLYEAPESGVTKRLRKLFHLHLFVADIKT